MRVLIVDDEAPARRRLRQMLARHADVRIVGEAEDAGQAAEQIERLRPCAIFLDIRMPGLDGLSLASALSSDGPGVVFVSGLGERAVEAFDVEAVDFLLKPLSAGRLERALARLRAIDSAGLPRQRRVRSHLPIIISDRGTVTVLAPHEVDWVAAEGNYVRVHAGSRSFMLRQTLGTLLARLGPAFARIHRGIAVRVAQVSALQTRAKGDATVVLRDARTLPCSRLFRPALRARLEGDGASASSSTTTGSSPMS